MALIDSENPSNAQRPVSVLPIPGPRPIPHDYLARLPVLHAEAAENLRLLGFVGRSAIAASFLMVAGAVTLLLVGSTLPSDFVWSVLVLAGVSAMTFNYIRSQARAPLRRIRLENAAADLRAMLLYTGFAWGAGAFLVLPGGTAPVHAIAFAVLPAVALALLLRDESGVTAFIAPVAILAAAACLFRHGPGAAFTAAIIPASGIAIVCALWLRGSRPRPASGLPGAA
jgi:hypothetical protein